MSKNFVVNNFELDNYQMKLLENDTNALVIAGAGSGKTLTILGKVNYLIEYKNIKPEEIVLVSFTNASVDDIKKKLKYDLNVFTFHKLAIFILKKYNFEYTLCPSSKLKFIINEYLKTANKKEKQIILKFLKLNINYNNFLKSNYYNYFCNLIETFINLYKANNVNYNDFSKIKYKRLEKKILLIIFNIYKIYINEKRSTNSLDFDDLIIYATRLSQECNLNFKYIIIDEFQDTSLIRLNLIEAIHKKEHSKIIVVGDDYQSIYHFSGCDLNIFLNFKNYFNNTEEIKLVNTYRNSQELINIASTFIQKNKKQIKKELVSKKHNNSPIIFVPYSKRIDKLKQVLNYLLKITKDILILIRNNQDIYHYIDKEITITNDYITYKNINIKYLTVHKSKGLEAHYTILLNCNNDHLGFPNKIENNIIIDKLFRKETISFEEERRLFYVALTRCKETIFILYDKSNPSIFIPELKRIIKKELNKVQYFK